MNDNYNFRGEVIKDYENINSAIKDLTEYIKNDEDYEKYMIYGIESMNDVQIFEINHIKALKKLIEEYQKIAKEMEKIKNENIK